MYQKNKSTYKFLRYDNINILIFREDFQ